MKPHAAVHVRQGRGHRDARIIEALEHAAGGKRVVAQGEAPLPALQGISRIAVDHHVAWQALDVHPLVRGEPEGGFHRGVQFCKTPPQHALHVLCGGARISPGFTSEESCSQEAQRRSKKQRRNAVPYFKLQLHSW